MSRYFEAEIRENRPVHAVHNLLTLAVPPEMPEPCPGQFFMIEVNRGTDPLLKRAFSLFRRTPEGIQLLYRIRGKGTAILQQMKAGTKLDMLGPLGTFYPAPPEGRTPLVVAGGIGVASVYSFVEQMAGRAIVFYGARTAGDLLMKDELQGLAKELHLSTDDGSAGLKGTAADALAAFLATPEAASGAYSLYSCGPHPLLKSIAGIAMKNRLPSYLSMEEHMACGIGACLGCVVKTRDGYARACKEGPVFEGRDLVW